MTFVDGRQHDFWRVDADRLRAGARAVLTRRRPAGGRGPSHMC